MADAEQITAKVIEPPLNLIPVGLKEAALDSPTFRAIAVHFADQVDAVERWLESYIKAVTRLSTEASQFESVVNGLLAQSVPPASLSEAVIDHDYALLAMRRFSEGARESWNQTLRVIKRYDTTVIEPIKAFQNAELRSFKEARRALENDQKNFDGVIARYLAQSKTKEASSLREDAFQVHEARKAYLKASLDFSVAGPLLRDALDKLLVRIFTEQWKEMRLSREATAVTFSKMNHEMERVRGWSKEMENSERAFRRELMAARKQIEDNAAQMIKPSRDLTDYETSTVPYLGTAASTTPGKPSTAKTNVQERGEKQGWLFMKTVVGKPARTVWSRRWFFVKNGIFGWLAQGSRSGGVEESEKIGVLLCGVKPAFQEERRFCFEVKTKDTSIILQSETQSELSEWIGTFEFAKRRALENPRSIENSPLSPGDDPAFAITPPISTEFAAKAIDGHSDRTEDALGGLSVPDREGATLPTRASFDVGAGAKRVASLEKEPDGSRDHAARIMQKLDLHKRSAAAGPSNQATAPMGGGIASLISASHNLFPVGPMPLPQPTLTDATKRPAQPSAGLSSSTLAPTTLANPPAPTNLSHTAVLVSSERGIALGGRVDGSGMPGGIMANLWGSSNWGYVNRLGDNSNDYPKIDPPLPAAAPNLLGSVDDVGVMDGMDGTLKDMDSASPKPEILPSPRHRKTMSAAGTAEAALGSAGQVQPVLEVGEAYPNYYPLALKAQHAQFRILFPSVPRTEKLVLVFRATWNPNEQQEFPGRVYVTEREIYFYSHYLGLVLITGVNLTSISEVTAAPGRNCDFLYLLLKEDGRQEDRRRITVRVFLDSLRLLQQRLSFLIANANAAEPAGLEEVIKTLVKMEAEEPKRSLSVDSWEDLHYDADEPTVEGRDGAGNRRERNIKASLRIDGDLYGDASKTGRQMQKLQLPRQPVVYAPQGMLPSTSREFNISAKALFHLVFGDKSAVFQLLYSNRWAEHAVQTPWTKQPPGASGRWTRQFSSHENRTPLADSQTIDVMNDHLCYVVTQYKRPWRLPFSKRMLLVTKLVITHSAKSKCKFAVFQKVVWQGHPPVSYLRTLVERQALNGLQADALDLSIVAMDQVSKLGTHSKTNKAIEIFGGIGTTTAVVQIDASVLPNLSPAATAAAKARSQQSVGIVRLVFSDVVLRLLKVFSILVDVAIAISKGTLSICTTHTLLVALLASSVLYNGWYGYRDSVAWWHERNASKYMARLGVKPEPMVTRAVYLTDIEHMLTPTVQNDTMAALAQDEQQRHTPQTCRTTFGEMLTTSSSSLTADASTSAQRLHRSRAAIAKYRHDLMVAIRVVNRVEKDIVRSGWEDWVHREEGNCARVEQMIRLQTKQKEGETQASGENVTASELDSVLGVDFKEYCASCRYELAEIQTGYSLI